MIFTSDNAVGVPQAMLDALATANQGAVPSYGDDDLTARVESRLCDVFERDVSAFLVATGTAANALSLSAICLPYGIVYCHEESHIYLEECGAGEFYTGGARLAPIAGFGGKITPDGLDRALSNNHRSTHELVPCALSLTQTTECGTVYAPEEIAALGHRAKHAGLRVHMDGARFANAVASLGCAPADVTWRSGIDILSFGATKNGALAAEAVVVFDADLARELGFRRKRAGHLWSKMRFLAAQIDAYLTDDLWLASAGHANAMAARLADRISSVPGCRLPWPRQANEVFVILPQGRADALRTVGAQFHEWTAAGLEGTNHTLAGGEVFIRLVTSFATQEAEVNRFAEMLAAGESG